MHEHSLMRRMMASTRVRPARREDTAGHPDCPADHSEPEKPRSGGTMSGQLHSAESPRLFGSTVLTSSCYILAASILVMQFSEIHNLM